MLALAQLDQFAGSLFREFGPTGGFLLLMGIAIWRASKWMKPLIERLVEGHLAFVKATAEANSENSRHLQELVEEHKATREQIVDGLKDLQRAVKP